MGTEVRVRSNITCSSRGSLAHHLQRKVHGDVSDVRAERVDPENFPLRRDSQRRAGLLRRRLGWAARH